MKRDCDFSDPRDPRHCWHWTGATINRAAAEPAEERVCCKCSRLGLARLPELSDHGPYRPASRGLAANEAEFVA